jgi:sucrose-6-phosphate hydrolase SacC (GH32 family)
MPLIPSVAIALVAVCLASFVGKTEAAVSYREPYRPQFHFTPATNWMNDPNGMVFFDGEYHLFYQYNPFGDKWGHMSWGHAVTRDLVHWEHLPVALYEENGVMIFSGSAVVDWKNTSGFGKDGKPPMIAIYTGHYTGKPLQNQHIAYSNDRGRTWTKYSGNPVLDIGEKDFRDPKVMWHEPTGRWVMSVAWPVPRKVRFYSSPDLKQWTHLSDFGPAGSTTGIWECPDLFPLRAGGRRGVEKWVLVVNVGSGAPAGGSGCQYFVGDFDGKNFTLDQSYPKAMPEFVPDGKVIGDFEGGTFGDWTAAGDAFGKQPAGGALPNQQSVSGFRGRGLANSHVGGDKSEGTLTSPEFEISHSHLNFLIGGGNHAGRTCLNLLVGGNVVRTATGDADEKLSWKSWDLREWRGRQATLQLVDQHTGGWGHINVDHIGLADAPARPAEQPALWADWGRDFYAAVSWSDVPPRDGRRLWLGWMSNWEYANDVPTSPWRSAMSIPRSLAVREVDGRWQVVQAPVREMESLRGPRERVRLRKVTAAADVAKLQNATRGLYELEASLHPSDDAEFELALGTEATGRTLLHFDVPQQRLTLDRRHSGRVDFHKRFPGAAAAPLRLIDGRLTLRVFVDASSVEVFVNDGETVMTSLILPNSELHGISLAVQRGELKRADLTGWKLRSGFSTRTTHERPRK